MWQAVLIDGAAACRRTEMTETDRKVDGGCVLPTYRAIIRLTTCEGRRRAVQQWPGY